MSGSRPIDRRTFLAGSAGLLGAAAFVRTPIITRVAERLAPQAAAPVLGPGQISSNVPSTLLDPFKAPKQKKGGTLIIGSLGGLNDSVDAQHYSTNTDQERLQNLYEGLTLVRASLPYQLDNWLAEEIEVNKDLTLGTVRLRKGIEFHHGKTMNADDLIFTLQRLLNPKSYGNGHTSLTSININTMYKVDDYTVRFPLNFPDALFGYRSYSIIPVDYDPANPVGTGPFMYQSFTPGSQSTFVRFPNYHVANQPYLDELQIIDFTSDQSRTAALLSGQVNAVDSIDPSLLGELHEFQHMVTKSGYYQPITMRVDLPPFNDARVREAMRLLVDRPQMVKQAYSNYAVIANDMPDPADASYPHHLPQRHQDLDKAVSLLKAAGYYPFNATLTTAPQDGDIVNSAQVFIENANSAPGVNITLNNLTETAYEVGFTKWPFTQGYWAAGIIETGFSGRWLPGATNNDSHWSDPTTINLYNQMIRTIDVTRRNELCGEILKNFYNDGPDVVHTFKHNVDVFSKKFEGFVPFDVSGWSLGGYRYRNVYTV